jgi:hypothetical protein
MKHLSTAEYLRLGTWMVEIADTLLPGSQREDRGADWRFSHSGGLSIRKLDGAWWSFGASTGGHSAIKLIGFLKQCSNAEAIQWGIAWLAAQAGNGSCDGGADDTDDDASSAGSAASAARAKEVLTAMVPAAGTIGETYLRMRDCPPPYPDCVRWLKDARTGESALVGVLTAHDVIVGCQLTYLDAFGRKSLHAPVRQTFKFDRERAKGAVFAVEKLSGNGVLALAEGLEDALSVAACGWQGATFGLPGIGNLQSFPARRGQDIVVVRDGDVADSPADKGLIRGVDHLLLQGAKVKVTQTPRQQEGEEKPDANSILQKEGAAALSALIEGAEAAKLSLAGEVTRLSRLPEIDYVQQRRDSARTYRIPAAALDRLVQRARGVQQATAASAAAADDAAPEMPADEPWDGPPVVLREVLDEALVEVRRYLVAPPPMLHVLVMWVAAVAHLVHHATIRIRTAAKLHFRSIDEGCGKSTAMTCVAELSPKAIQVSSTTASPVLRGMSRRQPTLCIDEAHRVFVDPLSDLAAIANCSHRRRDAYVWRSVPSPDGGWVDQLFPVWGAMVLASHGTLHNELQARCLSWQMFKALTGEIPEQMEDETSPKLIELRRRLTAWAEALADLPKPTLPPILLTQPGRVADNWRPLLAVATLAGGPWPQRMVEAIAASLQEDTSPSLTVRLLTSILHAFEAQREQDKQTPQASWQQQADNPDRLTTPTLIERLCNDPEEEWSRANKGHDITAYYLREHLRGALIPPRAQNWWSGPEDKRVHHSGYTRAQLIRAWETRIPGAYMAAYAPGSGASGASGAAIEKTGFSGKASGEASGAGGSASGAAGAAGNLHDTVNPAAAPDADPPAPDASPDREEKKSTKSTTAPDAPDAPDARGEAPSCASVGLQPEVAETSHGNGTRKPSVKRLRPVERAIIELAEAHPGWDEKRLSREAGQPLDVVRKALNKRAQAEKPSGNGKAAEPEPEPEYLA